MNVSGVTLTTTSLEVGNRGTGTLTVSGTGMIINNGNLQLGNSGNSTGVVNLNSGGTLETKTVEGDNTSSSTTFNFNGGTLVALSSSSTFFSNADFAVGHLVVQSGGAVINTNGFNDTIAQALVHDPASNAPAADGGLTKNGSGTLTLAGASTYTGGTVVNAGTLQVSGAGTLGATFGDLTVNTSGTVDLNGTSQAVGGLNGAGTLLNSASSKISTLTAGTGDANGSYSGVIEDNAGSGGTVALAKSGAGTQTLSGPNTYSGGTTVSAGTLLAGNTSGSATGTGSLTVKGGAAIGGYGSSSGTSFSISGTSTATNARANVLVGLNLGERYQHDAFADAAGLGLLDDHECEPDVQHQRDHPRRAGERPERQRHGA